MCVCVFFVFCFFVLIRVFLVGAIMGEGVWVRVGVGAHDVSHVLCVVLVWINSAALPYYLP